MNKDTRSDTINRPPHELWGRGIELFNQGEFFECHEVLEDLWNLQSEPEKQLTQGVLQIAVGYLHLGRNNPVGALKLLRRGLQRVQPFRPASAGVLLDDFANSVNQTILAIENESEPVAPPRIHLASEAN